MISDLEKLCTTKHSLLVSEYKSIQEFEKEQDIKCTMIMCNVKYTFKLDEDQRHQYIQDLGKWLELPSHEPIADKYPQCGVFESYLPTEEDKKKCKLHYIKSDQTGYLKTVHSNLAVALSAIVRGYHFLFRKQLPQGFETNIKVCRQELQFQLPYSLRCNWRFFNKLFQYHIATPLSKTTNRIIPQFAIFSLHEPYNASVRINCTGNVQITGLSSEQCIAIMKFIHGWIYLFRDQARPEPLLDFINKLYKESIILHGASAFFQDNQFRHFWNMGTCDSCGLHRNGTTSHGTKQQWYARAEMDCCTKYHRICKTCSKRIQHLEYNNKNEYKCKMVNCHGWVIDNERLSRSRS